MGLGELTHRVVFRYLYDWWIERVVDAGPGTVRLCSQLLFIKETCLKDLRFRDLLEECCAVGVQWLAIRSGIASCCLCNNQAST